ncbi:MAG: CarD family transcriptional regulator [Bryobacterales bacterium]|nr:CarD family transcriptional regulator [Bryobacterales bacterium]
MMIFRVGEKVVYPNHGVATVENISSRSFGSQFERFYLLRLMYSTMTVMVPFSHVGNVGLRPITKLQEVDRVLEFLACGDRSWQQRLEEPFQRELHQDAHGQPWRHLRGLQGSGEAPIRQAAFVPRKENA